MKLKDVYKANQCTDSDDVGYAMRQVRNLIEYNAVRSLPILAVQRRLYSLKKKLEIIIENGK